MGAVVLALVSALAWNALVVCAVAAGHARLRTVRWGLLAVQLAVGMVSFWLAILAAGLLTNDTEHTHLSTHPAEGMLAVGLALGGIAGGFALTGLEWAATGNSRRLKADLAQARWLGRRD